MKKLLPLLLAWLLPAGAAIAQTFTVTPSSNTYSAAGGQMLFTVNLTYPTDVTSVSLAARPPSGTWSYIGTGGTNIPDGVTPKYGDTINPSSETSKLGWAYINAPTGGSASFTFILSYPAGLSGGQDVTFTGEIRRGQATPTAVTVAAANLAVSTATAAPAVVYQPADATRNAGTTEMVEFIVGTTGVPAPNVQWQRMAAGGTTWANLTNDSTYAGVTTGKLTVTGLTAAMSGDKFRAVASSTAGADATSNQATLTVQTAPTITKQPVGLAVLAGETATFAVTASGSAPLSYQWYFTATGTTTPQTLVDQSGKRSGTQAATLTITNTQTSDVGDYVCIVSNAAGNATSTAAPLAIAARIVKVVSQTAAPNTNITVLVQLKANGDENALGFSLNFDPAVLSYQSVAVGANASDATLNSNVSQVATGKLGVALAKPTNAVWSAGTQEIAKVTFTVVAGTADGTVANIGFGDTPITREISSATATELTGVYTGGTVTVFSGYECDFNNDGRVSITEWVKVGRIVAGLDSVAAGVDFMKADCAPRSNSDGSLRLGNAVLSVTDWVQAGRYAAGLDPLTHAGGPTNP